MPLLPAKNLRLIPQARALSTTKSVPACGVAMGDLAGLIEISTRQGELSWSS